MKTNFVTFRQGLLQVENLDRIGFGREKQMFLTKVLKTLRSFEFQ